MTNSCPSFLGYWFIFSTNGMELAIIAVKFEESLLIAIGEVGQGGVPKHMERTVAHLDHKLVDAA